MIGCGREEPTEEVRTLAKDGRWELREQLLEERSCDLFFVGFRPNHLVIPPRHSWE